MSENKTVCLSCVVENDSVYMLQTINLIGSVLETETFKPENIFIHFIDDEETNLEKIQIFKNLGIQTRLVKRFGFGEKAYCNKLMQLSTPEFYRYDVVVFCDTDIVFVENVRQRFNTSVIHAKEVDLPNPPLDILSFLFEKTGISIKPQLIPTSFGKSLTFKTNCNGGIYIIPTQYLNNLSDSWLKWANFAFQNQSLLGKYIMHSDQIGFCFAMLELDLPFELLPLSFNFPTHLELETYRGVQDVKPAIFHYHKRMDQSGFLLPIGIHEIDCQIFKVNESLKTFRKKYFNNKIFWDFRYRIHPELGSGVGSRDHNLNYRKNILYPWVYFFGKKEILDVGCGDLELMAGFEAEKYTGLDISNEAISIASKKKPDWKFIVGDINSLNLENEYFDLVLCGCVLIHQPTKEQYLGMVKRLIDICKDTMIIEAYNRPPEFTSEMTFYYEPINKTLERDPRIDYINVIGSYRDIDIILARRAKRIGPSSACIPIEHAVTLLQHFPERDLLRELLHFSFNRLSFFPKTPSRIYEYIWIIKEIGDVEGKEILDIDAGVSPLPLWFACRGAKVTTIDNSPIIRILSNSNEWNEWGFFDYSLIDKSIDSVHTNIVDFKPSKRFDLIYSVSVIEHISAKERVEILRKVHELLLSRGTFLITLDLIPETNQLWNLSEGKIIENTDEHGTLETFFSELISSGFVIVNYEIKRAIQGSRTDVVFIKAAKPKLKGV